MQPPGLPASCGASTSSEQRPRRPRRRCRRHRRRRSVAQPEQSRSHTVLHHVNISPSTLPPSRTVTTSSAAAGATMPSSRDPMPMVDACTSRPSAMRAMTGLGSITVTPREPKWSIPSSTTAAVKRPLPCWAIASGAAAHCAGRYGRLLAGQRKRCPGTAAPPCESRHFTCTCAHTKQHPPVEPAEGAGGGDARPWHAAAWVCVVEAV